MSVTEVESFKGSRQSPVLYVRLPDADLVRRANDGDKRALETLVERYSGKVSRLASSLLGDIEDARDAVDPAPVDGALVGARRDVVEHDFVGTLVAITRRELEDVADDAVVAKLHAFDDDAVAHVEARDYAFGENRRISSSLMRPSSSARPAIAAATPVAASASRSAASRTPPEA